MMHLMYFSVVIAPNQNIFAQNYEKIYIGRDYKFSLVFYPFSHIADITRLTLSSVPVLLPLLIPVCTFKTNLLILHIKSHC